MTTLGNSETKDHIPVETLPVREPTEEEEDIALVHADGNNASADERKNVQEEPVEPFTLEEVMHLTRMDATHDPVLAEYWGDDADDDLIANP